MIDGFVIDQRALGPAMVAVFMRCLPFAVYVWLDRHCSWRDRAFALTAGIGLVATTGFGVDHLWIGVALSYFTLASAGVYWLERAHRGGVVGAGAVFVICTFAFLFVPTVLLPGNGELIAIAFGWELSFSAYSYCLDARSKSRAPPAWRDCLFFMMVNPVLVYPDRGPETRVKVRPWGGLARAVVGLTGLLSAVAFLLPLLSVATELRASTWVGAAGLGVGLGTLRFVCAYFVQAGTVNLRIGMMHALGYRVGDSFNYPFLSSSPTDFWRRWNSYMLNWLKRYVYRPLTRVPWLRRTGALGLATAVLFTFVASGLLHETQAYVRQGRWVGNFALQFAMVAGGTVLWLAADRLLKVAATRSRVARPEVVGRARSWLARAVIVMGMLAMPRVWG